jgi:uncharacterized hydrophobic protein (TIGR00271 family)
MSFFSQFANVAEVDKTAAVEKLIKNSTPEYSFFFMVVLSILMATFGLLIDSAAVVIGSMLIAPILYPILSLSLGVVMSDHNLISRSLYTVLKSVSFGVSAAAIATIIFAPEKLVTAEILQRTTPSMLYLFVAIVSGIAVAFAYARPQLSEAFPGVAVSVALIPPIAVVGIGIAYVDFEIVRGAAVLFLLNIIGVVVASTMSFSLLNLYTKKKVAEDTIKKEEKRVEKEEEKAEKIANGDATKE